MSQFWTIDNATYCELQQLKEFVQLVVGLKQSTKDDKQKADEIAWQIENINYPATFKSWYIALDIFDDEIRYGTGKKEGFYWRQWLVSHHYGDDFSYNASIYFGENIPEKRILMDISIANFVADALQFKKYIKGSMNNIEVDIAC